jgi:hypothetical protein
MSFPAIHWLPWLSLSSYLSTGFAANYVSLSHNTIWLKFWSLFMRSLHKKQIAQRPFPAELLTSSLAVAFHEIKVSARDTREKGMKTFLQSSVEPWLFQVEPYSQESFSHFLGRFCRANCLSSAHLAAMLGARSHVVAYRESPSRQQRPGLLLLQQLTQLTGVSVNRLQAMWLSPATALYWPTRLCPDCYAEAP